jgi:hypothetical protein
MKQYITEAQRLQKLAGITEARIVPQRMKRPLKGSISAEEWEAIGPGFTTDEWGGTIYVTPQEFHFFTDPETSKLSCELLRDDFDFVDNVVDNIKELKKQLNAAGYDLETVNLRDDDMMLYIPV